MAKKQLLLLVSLMLVLGVFLAACTGKDKDGDKGKGEGNIDPGKESGEEKDGELSFPLDVSNKDKAIEDGELTYALVSDDPFEGTLNKVFYSGNPDYEVMKFFDESLFSYDADYLITNDGAATFEISEDNKTIDIKIKDGVKWHDGEPVKASDLLYAYELLGHPDYTGDRYSFMIENVEGMPAYHKGETKEISGIKVSEDDKEISITYKVATPSLLSGIWDSPVPRHYLGDMTIEEIMSSEKIRTKPIGFGPYKVSKVVPGESVLYERYDDYWRGKPALKSLVLKVVSNASILETMKKGEVDIASLPTDQYENAKKLDNAELLGKVDLAYTYIGFKMGKWDAENKVNVMDPNSKLADKRVRQAMWHAIDNETVGKELYHGLRFAATTHFVPVHESFFDAKNPGRPFDPEKAKALLDEAGYVDVDGDGFREDANGKEFVLNFASRPEGDIGEPLAQFYIQNWADVGIKVQLKDGRLVEFNAFYDLLENDDPGVDIYQGGWGVGSDPDPEGIHGRTAAFNFPRWTNDKNDELLAAGTSEKAFDLKYRVDIYKQWQELMIDEVPLAPTLYRYELFGVNKRVVNYSIDQGSDLYLYQMGVSK